MSDAPFVDNDGVKIGSFNDLRAYQRENPFTELVDTILHIDDDHEEGVEVIITTRQSGLVHGFKTVVTCEADHDCKYHYFVFDTNGETEANVFHSSAKTIIEEGGDLE